MKSRNYLMSFQQVARILEENGLGTAGSPILNLKSVKSALLCGGRSVILSGDLLEKLTGTWWEAEVSYDGRSLLQFWYLADSLRDALRLRPNIDTSYWYSNTENASYYLSEVMAWQEDECLVD